jgi:hypothetical protein
MIASKTPSAARPGSDLVDGGDARRTVIPSPRRDGMFSGWGVRF